MIDIERLDNRIQQGAAALWRWCWRRLCPTLAILALMAVLAEPLACVLHCQIALPWMLAHQQVQLHTLPQPAAAPVLNQQMPDLPGFSARPPMLPANSNCFQAASDAPAPAVPPSPVHEIVLAAALLLVGAAYECCLPMLALPCALSAGSAPPTPPPRRSAFSR